MKLEIFLVLFAVAAISEAARPLFLAGNGAKLCTLNNVGTLPSTAVNVKYPVYQKVCRQVIPTALGDQVDDDFEEVSTNANNDEVADDEVEKIAQAIINPISNKT
jgi:hypothetical protein